MDHFQLESEVSLPGPSQPTPIAVYSHNATSMRFVFVSIPGPQATATIIVPTVTKDSRGLPHTLEHLVFCGSKNYPDRGYLDSLANRCLSTGTNAYTTEDHTGYTIATAGRDGMAEILPVFLDHVLHPTLRDDQYVTEVYHVDGEGKQQGVVFSEMASRENSEADLLDLGLRRLLYPKSQTYYHECGGLTPEIPKMSNQDIRDYHQKFYQPSNMAVVVTGDGLQPERIFDMIVRKNILVDTDTKQGMDIIQEMDLSKGREDAPIMNKDTKLTSRTIRFPSADEDVGSIGYGWLGPSTYDLKTMVGLDILFRFLHETSASPFSQAFVDRRTPLASQVDFEVKGCMDTSLILLFSGIPIRSHGQGADGKQKKESGDQDESHDEDEDEEDEDAHEDNDYSEHSDEEQDSDEEHDSDEERDSDDEEHSEEHGKEDDVSESQDLFEPDFYHGRVLKVLEDFINNGLSDPTEMTRVIARHRTKVNESIEDDPHEAATSYLVPDILAYAYLEKDKTKPAAIGTRSSIFDIIDDLDTMEPQYWKDLARKWLFEPSMVEVLMIPDSKLGKTLNASVAKKQQTMAEELGVDGLAKQAVVVTEAVEANKVNLSAEVMASMPPIPDASKVPTIPLTEKYVSVAKDGNKDLKPFNVIQYVETNTFFTHVKLCLPLTHLSEDLRPYLVLFQELIFQSACSIPKYTGPEGSEEIVFESLNYQEVVTLVSNTLVSHEAAVGFGNDIFACSWLSELFILACSAERSKFKEQCQLMLRVLMFAEFTEERVLTVAKILLSQIMELKRDGGDMLSMVSTRMTTPVRDYELSTKYCRKMDPSAKKSLDPAQLEAPATVLGNDMAISVFRQEPFLRKVIQELKQKTGQAPKVLARLERIKHSMLQSISEVIQSSKRNGNMPAVGFGQVGVPIGFGSGSDESKDPVQLLTDVWDQEYALYQASSGLSMSVATMANRARKRKPSEPFHQQQDQPHVRIMRDEVEATIKASNMTLNDGKGLATKAPALGSSDPMELETFPFPRSPYKPLAQSSSGSKNPSCALIPMKSITSSYLISIVPCDVIYHPELATEENFLDHYATLLLCDILSRSEGPLYSAVRGNGYAYDASLSVYHWTGQMAFEVRVATDPVKAYDAFLDIIRSMETDWDSVVGGQFEMETAQATRVYQTCMERATAGGVLSWILRGAIMGYKSMESLTKSHQYLYKVGVSDLKRVYHKYFKQFLNGKSGLTTVLLTPPSPPESIKTHFVQYGMHFEDISLEDFEIEPRFDFVTNNVSSPLMASSLNSSPSTSGQISPAETTAPTTPQSSSRTAFP
ncbi:hypothetical protein BGW38_003101 [Lunasporangiospora selenospora]|uniref:Zn-dependent peptidase n=1 Tax=Lunasporangiospora selenospora TaxID=979761 RepID=A0A9P6G2X8_9FUNG|nr:hypothetical protein BGW38_003101 [Lunasporangiospora selenospora]